MYSSSIIMARLSFSVFQKRKLYYYRWRRINQMNWNAHRGDDLKWMNNFSCLQTIIYTGLALYTHKKLCRYSTRMIVKRRKSPLVSAFGFKLREGRLRAVELRERKKWVFPAADSSPFLPNNCHVVSLTVVKIFSLWQYTLFVRYHNIMHMYIQGMLLAPS